jgi:hypothetical protein
VPDYGLRAAIGRYALACLSAGTLPDAGSPTPGLPAGVKPLDLWSNDRYGSVLFRVDRRLDVSLFDGALLLHHNANRVRGGEWRSTGGGGMGSDEPRKLSASLSPGLNRLGGGSQDPMRVTIGIASSDVAAICLRAHNEVHERPLGVDRFFLLGITFADPITYAYAVNREGEEVGGDPLLL